MKTVNSYNIFNKRFDFDDRRMHMKKNALCLLFLSSLLVTSCDFNGGNNDTEDIFDEPEIVVRATRPELFSLSRAGEPLLVDKDVKRYTDEMYKQRDTGRSEPEDKINNLHGDTVDVSYYMGNYDASIPVEVSFTFDESLKDEEFRYLGKTIMDDYHPENNVM